MATIFGKTKAYSEATSRSCRSETNTARCGAHYRANALAPSSAKEGSRIWFERAGTVALIAGLAIYLMSALPLTDGLKIALAGAAPTLGDILLAVGAAFHIAVRFESWWLTDR